MALSPYANVCQDLYAPPWSGRSSPGPWAPSLSQRAPTQSNTRPSERAAVRLRILIYSAIFFLLKIGAMKLAARVATWIGCCILAVAVSVGASHEGTLVDRKAGASCCTTIAALQNSLIHGGLQASKLNSKGQYDAPHGRRDHGPQETVRPDESSCICAGRSSLPSPRYFRWAPAGMRRR